MPQHVYVDCVHCKGRGYRYISGYSNHTDSRSPVEACSYCLGRGWERIMQKENDDCQTCGGYGWGKAGEHQAIFLRKRDEKGEWKHCETCHGTGRQPKEKRMEKKTLDETITEQHVETSAEVPTLKREAVIHPSHYNGGKIEVIDAIEDWQMGFNDGNVIKYVARHRMKLFPKEDLEKAFWYLTRELMSKYHVTEARLVEMVHGCVKDRPGTK